MWRVGTVIGLIAGAVGLLGWIYALFGPTGQYVVVETSSDGGSNVSETGTTSMWTNEDFHLVTVLFLLIMLICVLGVIIGSIIHGRRRSSSGRVLLWSSSITLLLGAILSAFSIGLFLLPAAILSVIAAAFAGSSPDRDGVPASRTR